MYASYTTRYRGEPHLVVSNPYEKRPTFPFLLVSSAYPTLHVHTHLRCRHSTPDDYEQGRRASQGLEGGGNGGTVVDLASSAAVPSTPTDVLLDARVRREASSLKGT